MRRPLLIVHFALFCCFLLVISHGATYYREDEDENGILDWEESDEDDERDPAKMIGGASEESAEAEDDEDNGERRSSKKLFKRFADLGEPHERWPTDFYQRTISICVEETVNGTRMHKKEREGTCPEGKTVAVGRYRNSVNESGWGIIELETFGGFSPEQQAYAAGLAEGSLTKLQIYYHFRNTVQGLCTNATAYCKKLYRYLGKNLEWISAQVQSNPNDLYWKQVNRTFNQLTGIFDGYGTEKGGFTPRTNFTVTPIFMIQLSGELFDLNHVFKKQARSKEEAVEMAEPGHCSGMVKVADGNKDLLMSHVAMSGYNTMNRMVKLYKFAYDPKEVPGYAVAFSGYPAALASADDFTLTSGGLLSIETTMAVFDESLYQKYVLPTGQLHCWLRSYIANQLTSTAHDWAKLFSRFNSGTYNNQWTVVDYKLFTPGQELPSADLVWVLEQIPGTIVSRDVTWFLRQYGYWPSYNIPYLRRISELSGFELKGTENDWWRWGFCPRAHIYHRDHHKVQDINSLRKFMRYNDYKHEEYSRCKCNPPYTAEASVSTRGDLNPANGTYELSGMGHRNHGSLDYKGTNYALFKQLRLEVVGGPTWGHESGGELPFFSWKTTDIKTPHYGQPEEWKFHPFVTQWLTPVEAAEMDDD